MLQLQAAVANDLKWFLAVNLNQCGPNLAGIITKETDELHG
jgi:hypothetical protein